MQQKAVSPSRLVYHVQSDKPGFVLDKVDKRCSALSILQFFLTLFKRGKRGGGGGGLNPSPNKCCKFVMPVWHKIEKKRVLKGRSVKLDKVSIYLLPYIVGFCLNRHLRAFYKVRQNNLLPKCSKQRGGGQWLVEQH